MAEEKEEKPKKAKDRFEVIEITTQTAPVIKDNESEEIYNELTALCKVMNDVIEIKKNLS